MFQDHEHIFLIFFAKYCAFENGMFGLK
jgi:hypothetical protein